jgi:hypothetical protein
MTWSERCRAIEATYNTPTGRWQAGRVEVGMLFFNRKKRLVDYASCAG